MIGRNTAFTYNGKGRRSEADRAEPPPHFLRHLAADLARGLGRMLGSPGSDIGVDLPGRERQQIVLAAIARVRRNLPRLASEVGPEAEARR